MPRARLLLAAVAAIALVGLPTAAQPAATAASGATYYLPAPAGTKLTVTQGQNTPSDHNAANGSQFAWDFGVAGNGDFDVTAVRAGKVIGLRDNSQANCYSGGADMSCWKDANYALVDHGDGTSALYLHLAYGSAAVKVGNQVAAGQKLAKDDNTGFSSGNHLHFMVETTPAVPSTPPPGPTDKTPVAWWWTNSQPVAFSDPDVLAQDPDGIPQYKQTVTSGAPVPSLTPVVSGTWVAPKDGAKLTTSSLTLSAKPTVTPSTLSVARVAFSVKWGSTTKTACSATKAGAGGVWSCRVGLSKIGAPLGKLVLAFDVTDSAGGKAKAPAGVRTVTFAVPPPKPSNVRISESSDPSLALFRMTWGVGEGPVSSFKIYATPMSFCPAYRWAVAGSTRLVATLPASSRGWNGNTPPMDGFDGWRFAVAASNLIGRSASVVATHGPLPWDPAAADDVVTFLGTC